MPETANMNRQLFIEWIPQIMYNHHQTGPAGEVIFIPPFRDPLNHNFDPLVTSGNRGVGTAMHSRLVAQGKGGSGMRTQANYAAWWNGGMRNTATYSTTRSALLTEIIGSPTPMEIPLIPEKQLHISDLPLPIAPQPWHFRQTIDYLMKTNRAHAGLRRAQSRRLALQHLSHGDELHRARQQGLLDHHAQAHRRAARGGRRRRSIRGGAPRRTRRPAGATAAAAAEMHSPVAADSARRGVSAALYEKVLHDPKMRDPRGYIMPSDQPDFPTATHFINTLLKSGITVLQATGRVRTWPARAYPAGSYVVKTAQAFRPIVRDMFEPQDHPRRFPLPGGPPIPPYDIAGWTLAMQMGVQYDRILDGFDGPLHQAQGVAEAHAAQRHRPGNPAGYLISHRSNYSFTLVNRLLKANARSVLAERTDHSRAGATIWRRRHLGPASPAALPVIAAGRERSWRDRSMRWPKSPSGDAFLHPAVRIGLYDQYGGLMPSGWTRWLFEQYEFPFEVVYPQTLDPGDLKSRFDVLVFPTGDAAPGRMPSIGNRKPDDIPEEYRSCWAAFRPKRPYLSSRNSWRPADRS